MRGGKVLGMSETSQTDVCPVCNAIVPPGAVTGSEEGVEYATCSECNASLKRGEGEPWEPVEEGERPHFF
jgi:hypothetical protein